MIFQASGPTCFLPSMIWIRPVRSWRSMKTRLPALLRSMIRPATRTVGPAVNSGEGSSVPPVLRTSAIGVAPSYRLPQGSIPRPRSFSSLSRRAFSSPDGVVAGAAGAGD